MNIEIEEALTVLKLHMNRYDRATLVEIMTEVAKEDSDFWSDQRKLAHEILENLGD